jgi:hypothetical protein
VDEALQATDANKLDHFVEVFADKIPKTHGASGARGAVEDSGPIEEGKGATSRLFLLCESFLHDPLDQIDDASPHRLLLYPHECLCEGEPICRREEVGHVGG